MSMLYVMKEQSIHFKKYFKKEFTTIFIFTVKFFYFDHTNNGHLFSFCF